MAKPRTLYDKIWDDHLVDEQPDGTCLHLYRPPSRARGDEPAGVRGAAPAGPQGARAGEDAAAWSITTCRPPTATSPIPIRKAPRRSRSSRENAKQFGLEYFDEFDKRQGIVHIIGPEQGFTLPGTTIVCGDSHTATHGAFGALAYGIGTSEVEHVLATQTLIQTKSKNMRAVVDGKLPPGVTAKDIILAIIGEIGTAGGTGYALEYAGEAIRALSMEGRMTVCNMSVEGGAKAGFIAPDEKAYRLSQGPPARRRRASAWDDGDALLGDAALRRRRAFRPRDQARCRQAAAARHLGHQPRAGRSRSPGACRSPTRSPTRTSAAPRRPRSTIWASRAARRSPTSRSTASSSAPAPMAASRTCARPRASSTARPSTANVNAMIVPGSGLVKEQAEAEGLDKIFRRGRLRMARARLLDVPRHEPRQARARRALRLDLEPQFRGPPGLQGPHPSGVARHGGGGRDRRALRRRARVEVARPVQSAGNVVVAANARPGNRVRRASGSGPSLARTAPSRSASLRSATICSGTLR